MNSATPLLIQWLCSLSVPSSNIMMKLVLWPVVDSVPARVNVLYLQYQQHNMSASEAGNAHCTKYCIKQQSTF